MKGANVELPVQQAEWDLKRLDFHGRLVIRCDQEGFRSLVSEVARTRCVVTMPEHVVVRDPEGDWPTRGDRTWLRGDVADTWRWQPSIEPYSIPTQLSL